MRKVIASHIGLNPETQRQMLAGEIEVDLVPQGTLDRAHPRRRLRPGRHSHADRRRHGRRGRQAHASQVDGRDYLLETPLRADFALLEAFLADYLGNLTYALTARNFNPVMAMAADTVIVDAEHIVPVGMISPDHVMTPAALVDYRRRART